MWRLHFHVLLQYLRYNQYDFNSLGAGRYIHYGLGNKTVAGNWVTIRRNLQDDMYQAQPGCKILKVEAFLICGSGHLDRILL